MFFLKQLFRAREHMQISPENPEGYMSLLEHLEALRRTVIRMLITATLAMLCCFGFVDEIMALLRYPAESVRTQHEAAHLPADVSVQDWVQAKHTADTLPSLPPATANSLLNTLPPQVKSLALIIPYLRGAQLLPREQQAAWLQQHLTEPALHTQALALYESGALLNSGTDSATPSLMGAFQPGEAFMLSVQLAFFAGLIIAFPLLMYQLLGFIIPGLMEHEKRILYKSVAWGFLLFIGGCAFAYWGVLPRVLGFFYEYSLGMGIANEWRIGYYLTFALKLIFVFGVIFELPVIVIPLIKLGLLNYESMKTTRGYALIGCFAIALVLAPAPDPGTMLLMALPMYALYELCIIFARVEHRNRQHSTPIS
ncbi:MAG: twin-arginine translocase subunit TatC [Akkermansia sp.]|nr:twin-arginine translocase subunit TatC [Akkermansia sp.]